MVIEVFELYQTDVVMVVQIKASNNARIYVIILYMNINVTNLNKVVVMIIFRIRYKVQGRDVKVRHTLVSRTIIKLLDVFCSYLNI